MFYLKEMKIGLKHKKIKIIKIMLITEEIKTKLKEICENPAYSIQDKSDLVTEYAMSLTENHDESREVIKAGAEITGEYMLKTLSPLELILQTITLGVSLTQRPIPAPIPQEHQDALSKLIEDNKEATISEISTLCLSYCKPLIKTRGDMDSYTSFIADKCHEIGIKNDPQV